jgi:hypothetical protein
MEKIKMFCKECNSQTNYVIDNFCRYHLSPCHNMNTKEYYDKHIKKDGDGKCIECGKETTFKSFTRGYAEFCSIKCLNSSKEMSNRVIESKKGLDYNLINEKIKDTMLDRYGVEHALQADFIKNKMKENNMEKYGTPTTINLPKVRFAAAKAINEKFDEVNEKRSASLKKSSILAKIKRGATVSKKYGVSNISQVKETRIKSEYTKKVRYGFKTHDELGQYQKYEKEVRQYTNKNVINLEKCKTCYYTNILLDYTTSDPSTMNQATVDHKISVIFGFRNNIPACEIGALHNLCYCSRLINSIKNYKCEKEFVESKKFKRIMEKIHDNTFTI